MGVPGTRETAAESTDPALAPIPCTSTSDDGQPSRDTSNIQLDETEEPLSWPASKKWLCTIVVVAMTATIGFCSSIHTAAIADIAQSFSCPRTVATLGVSTFLLGFATGPLIFGPLSEVWGRNAIYRSVLLLFVLFNVGCALAPNIAVLLVFRFFCGFFGSPTVTNSGGSLTDMWPQSHRTVPLALFTAASFLGPVIAPIVGGFVAQYSQWRWDYWIFAIVSGLSYIAMLAVLPETYTPVLLAKTRTRLEGRHPTNVASPQIDYYTTLTRPWIMLFTEPILFLLSLYMAFCYGLLYLDFTAHPLVFTTTRGWLPGASGLSLLGIGAGMALATACSPLLNRLHTHYARKLASPGSPSPPEARLPHLLPAALFWFARTAPPPHHWALPVAAGAPFGFAFVALFLAAAAVLRGLFGAAFPLFAGRMYERLGVAWAGCLLGFVAVGLAPMPWGFYVWGPWLRARSRFYLRAVEADVEGGRAAGRGEEVALE